jgi:hypothetical protein
MIDRIIIAGIILFSAVILSYSDFGSQGRVYDCGMAEWHPDIPNQVKEECRRLRDEYRRQEEKKDSKIYI